MADVNKDNKPENESRLLPELNFGSTVKRISSLVAKQNHQTMLNKAEDRNISTQYHTLAKIRAPAARVKSGYLNQ